MYFSSVPCELSTEDRERKPACQEVGEQNYPSNIASKKSNKTREQACLSGGRRAKSQLRKAAIIFIFADPN
jgi:hypothetical protein